MRVYMCVCVCVYVSVLISIRILTNVIICVTLTVPDIGNNSMLFSGMMKETAAQALFFQTLTSFVLRKICVGCRTRKKKLSESV